MTIGDVILVQKTHLDIGFTDLPSRVLNQYMEHFIPKAMAMARALADAPEGQPRFVWTTGSYLIWLALERYTGDQRKELEAAIAQGWLRWHALPFTTHTELADANLFRAGLRMAQDLDERFGFKTQAAKMTDVPGHSMAMVPLLAEAGVKLLHIGVNPASTLPQVPSAFRWRHPQGAEVTVLYGSGYGDALPIPGSQSALAFLHTNDNLGPPALSTLQAEYAALAAQFAGARIRAGTLEDVVEKLDPQSLPVIEQEIGDSWLHGVGSAPQRVSNFLALRRALASAPDAVAKNCAAAQTALLVAEHTWGLDSKGWLPSHDALSPDVFAHERRCHAWEPLTQAYAEQDAYVSDALSQLADATQATQAQGEIAAAQAIRALPQPGPTAQPFDRWSALTSPRWVLRVDPANGVLRMLYDRFLQQDVCAGGGRLGILRYQVLGAQRFQNWVDNYLLPNESLWWADEDFNGPRQDGQFPVDLLLPTRAEQMWVERRDGALLLTIHHACRHPRVGETGIPPLIGMQWMLPDDPAAAIELRIGWDEKPAALAREALWFGWRQGSVAAPQRIVVDKMGGPIDLATVVDDGGLLHATDTARLYGAALTTTMQSLDAPLFCPDGPRILERRLGAPDYSHGQWWNLLNTGWSTNFGFWTEGAMGYRFKIALTAAS